MILDTYGLFLEATDVSASTGTALEGDVIDLGRAGQSVGVGRPAKYLFILVTTTFTTGTTAEVQFILASDSVAAIAADGTETRHIVTDAYDTGDLTAGVLFNIPLPGNFPTYERYLGLEVVTSSAATTAGSITAGLVETPHSWTSYPDATN